MTTNTDGAMPELPENVREGAPYDCPRFESLCREHGIWGTPESALCAVFWRAAIQQAAGAVPEGCRIVPMEPSEAMLDRAVAFALNVSLGGSYGWTDYMRDLYARMLSAVPSKAGSSVHLGGGEGGGVQVSASTGRVSEFEATMRLRWLKDLIQKQQDRNYDQGRIDPETGAWEGPEWAVMAHEELDALYEAAEKSKGRRFEWTRCSQCGQEFGPGDCGYSSCTDHQSPTAQTNQPAPVQGMEGGV